MEIWRIVWWKHYAPTTSNKSFAPALNYVCNKARVKFDGSCLKQDKTTFTHKNITNIYIINEINFWPCRQGDITLGNALFGVVELVENDGKRKYKYSGYGLGFDNHGFLSVPGVRIGKNGIIFGADMSLSTHIDNKGKYVLVPRKDPMQGLDGTKLNSENMYSINFTKTKKKMLKLAL